MKKGRVKEAREDDVIINIGKNLKKFRELKGLSQIKLAVLCNKEDSSIAKYEKGKIEASVSTLSILAKALDIKISQLFEDYIE